MSAMVLQSGFCGSDTSVLKKIELAKKNCEDNNEEEGADDFDENEYEHAIALLFSCKNFFTNKSLISHIKLVNLSQSGYWSIYTPPPEFEN